MPKRDFINRDDLLAAYDAAHKGPPGGARKLIAEAPAADVEIVVHSHWVKDRPYHHYCANCKEQWGQVAIFMRHCPGCGARMDGEVEDLSNESDD